MKVKVNLRFAKKRYNNGFDYGHELFAICWYKTDKMLLPRRCKVSIHYGNRTYESFSNYCCHILKDKEEIKLKIIGHLKSKFKDRKIKDALKEELKNRISFEFDID